jgi:ribonuclease J
MIEICAVGGYLEVGRNLTAIRYKDEAILLDMGVHLENYIAYTEDEDIHDILYEDLQKVGAVPDINRIKTWLLDVKAIIPGHAHLDHIGAIPFLSRKFDCPILLTPYSHAVLEQISKDNKIPIPNKIRVLSDNSTYQISKNITIEFINVTHSVPDSVMIAIHTPDGTVLYTGDYKFDDTPMLGKITNYKRLNELKNVRLLIMDSLYSSRKGRTSSEKDAQKMLESTVFENVSKKNGLIVTTFSSLISRLKSIVELGHKLKRKIVFLGRSLSKYTAAAEEIGLVRFTDDVEIVRYSSQVSKRLKQILKDGKEKYMIVCTGHQAEKKAVLSKMINKGYYNFSKNDVVIFSCITIPSEPNLTNRKILEEKLESLGARVFKDIHSSGHASMDDQKMLIEMVNPKIVMPYHCVKTQADALSRNISIWNKEIEVKILKEGDFLTIE